MKSFFQDKFEYDFICNRKWSEVLIENENLINDFIIRSMSHIINVHHIWISRVDETEPESHSWDKLPMDYWISLSQENYNRTIEFLEHLELTQKVDYHSEEGVELSKEVVDILYHILNHNNYHRAQISLEMRKLGIQPPSFNFITFR